ncbi:hypothetical protein ACHQM5_002254 [Ranunculus cassubicifolius]
MLSDETVGSSRIVELIDDLQRLGIGYHFNKEINRALDLLSLQKDACIGVNLQCTSLYFRLLRQNGYSVTQDVFSGFIDVTGSFKLELSEDIKGILSLYEASHLCLKNDDILHEAKIFTAKHLKDFNGSSNPSIANEITRSLEVPLHWRMPRLEAGDYITYVYEREEKINHGLLELAILDFNVLQATYQQELCDLSRWWKRLGLSDELTFARDRLRESFLASVGVAYEPQYRCCREWITKVVCLILAMDDIYDSYAELEELENFTAAVERWDLRGTEQLPYYLRICFLALFNTTNEIVYMKYKEMGLDVLSHLKIVWKDFCNAMLLEAKWGKTKHIPTLVEYLENAWVSSSTTVGLVVGFFGSKQIIADGVLESLKKRSDLIYYSSMILRLCNDLATTSAEMERGDVPSSIQCYMHETTSSEKIAREKIKLLIAEMWMKLNESVLDSTFDKTFVYMVVNTARTAHSIYQNGDGFSVQDHKAKKRLMKLLFQSIDVRAQDK